MNLLDTMKQALEALEIAKTLGLTTTVDDNLRNAIAEIEKAEPVAWYGVTGDYGFPFLSFQEQPGMTPLYTRKDQS